LEQDPQTIRTVGAALTAVGGGHVPASTWYFAPFATDHTAMRAAARSPCIPKVSELVVASFRSICDSALDGTTGVNHGRGEPGIEPALSTPPHGAGALWACGPTAIARMETTGRGSLLPADSTAHSAERTY
jgi:hypothetical protein